MNEKVEIEKTLITILKTEITMKFWQFGLTFVIGFILGVILS